MADAPADPRPDHIRGLMDRPANIRNVAVVGQLGVGKSTIVDALVGAPHADDAPPAMSVRAAAVAVCVTLDAATATAVPEEPDGREFLLHVVDTPGHADFAGEAAAALRLADGALVVLDGGAGAAAVGVHTEAVLRRAVAERVAPALVLNMLDRALRTHAGKEALYQALRRAVAAAGAVVAAFGDPAPDPARGAAAFGAARGGWGFTLRQFAARYSARFGVDREKMMARLWGDHFFDPATRRWAAASTDARGAPLERAFCMFVLDPICKIRDAAEAWAPRAAAPPVWERLDVRVADAELAALPDGAARFAAVMRRFVPLRAALAELAVAALPSPRAAQPRRAERLYDGPADDAAARGVRACSARAPLVLCVAKMLRAPGGGLCALGRVFGGTVRAGAAVRVVGAAAAARPVARVLAMAGADAVPLADCPAGNIVALAGVDDVLLRGGTLADAAATRGVCALRVSAAPVVQVAVAPRDAAQLPRLLAGLRRLAQADLCVQTSVAETGELLVAGVGALHVETCLKDLEDDCAGVALVKSAPFVAYRETVTAESSRVALSKSANKHNRLYARARPLGADLTMALESGMVGPRDGGGAAIAAEYGWDAADARKIWCFGPDAAGPNALVDATRGVQHLHEIRDACVAGFQWATREGVCAEEHMRGVRLNIIDATMVGDAIHRGGGQLIPTCRRVCYAAVLLATPGIQEPVYLVEIECAHDAVGLVRDVLHGRRGQVLSEERHPDTPASTVRAYLPVAESFGLSADLKSYVKGEVVHQSLFHHWELMAGTPLEKGSTLEALVSAIRTRKGLQPEIPALETYLDKL